MDKNKYNKTLKIITLLITISFITVMIIGKIRENEKHEEIVALVDAENEKLILEKEEKQLKEEKIKEILPGIVCWGDCLTAGDGGNDTTYPRVLYNLVKNNIYDIPVVNMGVAEEDTNTVLGRCGAIPFVVEKFEIPAEQEKVEIKIKSKNGNDVFPLVYGDKGVNPVYIQGIKGKIKIENYGNSYKYYFVRSESGESVKVKNETQIITSGTETYKDYINIIFIGENGGYDNYDDLIKQQKSIIKTLDKNKEKYLILGVTSGTANERAELEKKMKNEFGDKYINLRSYLSKSGLKDAGLTPTSEDLEYIEEGSIPPSLLSDSVHLNSDGYELLGNIVYERLIKLGYFDSIKDLI